MPREKQGKRKTKGEPQSIVSILQKFLKTYEKRCVQTQTSVCPAIKRDLKASINHERILRKVSVSSQETKEHGSSIPSSPELAGSPALRSCLHAVQSLTLAPKSARHSSYLPTPPSQSAHPVLHPSSSSACSHPASPPERPACLSSHSMSGESSSKASLLSSLQNLPRQHSRPSKRMSPCLDI